MTEDREEFCNRFRYHGGCLYYRELIGNKLPGDIAGKEYTTNTGHKARQVQVDGVNFIESRVIWIMHHGTIPEGYEVDHINRNSLDNRLCNLRLATHSQNVMNSINIRTSKSVSKLRGVVFDKRKKSFPWVAKIGYQGKRIHIGSYDNKYEAAKDYNDVAKALFGNFAVLNNLEEIGE